MYFTFSVTTTCSSHEAAGFASSLSSVNSFVQYTSVVFLPVAEMGSGSASLGFLAVKLCVYSCDV